MLMHYSVALVLAITAWSSPSQAQPIPCGVPESGTGDWQIGTPAAGGIEPRSLCALINKLNMLNPNIHSILVVRHGRLVFEHYREG
jgi:hypothetical protein